MLIHGYGLFKKRTKSVTANNVPNDQGNWRYLALGSLGLYGKSRTGPKAFFHSLPSMESHRQALGLQIQGASP